MYVFHLQIVDISFMEVNIMMRYFGNVYLFKYELTNNLPNAELFFGFAWCDRFVYIDRQINVRVSFETFE